MRQESTKVPLGKPLLVMNRVVTCVQVRSRNKPSMKPTIYVSKERVLSYFTHKKKAQNNSTLTKHLTFDISIILNKLTKRCPKHLLQNGSNCTSPLKTNVTVAPFFANGSFVNRVAVKGSITLGTLLKSAWPGPSPTGKKKRGSCFEKTFQTYWV